MDFEGYFRLSALLFDYLPSVVVVEGTPIEGRRKIWTRRDIPEEERIASFLEEYPELRDKKLDADSLRSFLRTDLFEHHAVENYCEKTGARMVYGDSEDRYDEHDREFRETRGYGFREFQLRIYAAGLSLRQQELQQRIENVYAKKLGPSPPAIQRRDYCLETAARNVKGKVAIVAGRQHTHAPNGLAYRMSDLKPSLHNITEGDSIIPVL